jgi:hypothetical protein
VAAATSRLREGRWCVLRGDGAPRHRDGRKSHHGQPLEHSWSDPNANIISLVAEGGAGKSALVNEWLTRLQADNYRGAATVLGWSFYSQGTKERAISSEEFLNWALATSSASSSKPPAPPPRARRLPKR